jgi:NAD(P)-dependent dehydrogenase (short-subunit alcohol dehydrogenase family)
VTHVLVTGGGRGIGRAIAERFATAGGAVTICGRSSPRDKLPAGLRFVACDVGDAGQVRALFAGLERLDLLVNNAGIGGENRLDAADDGDWHRIIATNLTGTYLCSKAALDLLPDETGRIINIASVLGLRGVPGATAYCAAKHGIVGFTRALALELAPRRITVNAICPSWVKTDMAEARWQDVGMSEKDAAAQMPTGRITTPEEVAGAAFYLASKEAGNITGQTLTLDGGAIISA